MNWNPRCICFATTYFIKIAFKNDKAWIILILQLLLKYLELVEMLLELKGKEVQTRTPLRPWHWPWETSLPFSFTCAVSLLLSSANCILQKSDYTFIVGPGNTPMLRYLMEEISSFQLVFIPVMRIYFPKPSVSLLLSLLTLLWH